MANHPATRPRATAIENVGWFVYIHDKAREITMPDTIDFDLLLAELPVRVLTSRLMHAKESWSGMTIRSGFWRLYCNARSGGSVVVDNCVYPLRPGRIHIVPAWLQFTTALKQPVEHNYLHFDLVGLPAPLVQELFPRPVTVELSDVGQPLVRAWLADLHAPVQQNLAAAFRAKALTHWALAQVMEQLPQQAQQRISRYYAGDDDLLPALEYIDRHLDALLTNDVLADRCAMSVDHFIRRFRQHTGQTPAQYVIDARIKHAAQLLIFTSQSIEAVATATGFRDRYYFSRVFAQRIGMAPATYRRTEAVRTIDQVQREA